ncbi:molybdopterin cofactor-binding domain-containing protein [Thalassotalea sp. PP2-459]|uniref:xanthine dehydrogenase family protein molybdopterin-binding subunit n=1 Tax=Thalassotalea sp. PP2-459 TaxID=1742724 RepID=UPI00094551CF|nr:molybdopterin cofactor-binding domain-containing protein [Thalassotalea sp. PP2-459]OKY26783.1 isoquinoline oxidoreductase subunit beta [Thalassotalea sp. PP2-459]
MSITNESRRQFLKASTLATGGLAISINLPAHAVAFSEDAQESTFSPNAFIHIQDNGDVLIYCGRCEMGQGINTALPAAVADEMDADWQRVTVKQADGNEEKYGPQATGGSASIRVMLTPMREAGASAKIMLIAAAAKVWNVDPSSCYAENHVVHHQASGKQLSYGQLASLAAKQTVPEVVTLKAKKDFNYIGKFIPNQNIEQIIKGQLTYGVDTKLPGLKYAAIVHCPVLGGKLKTLDDKDARAIKGVIDVVVIDRLAIPYGSIGGVAVVADNSWTAQQAVKKLKIEWDLGENAHYDTVKYKAQLVKNVETQAQLVTERGNVTEGLSGAAQTLKATYTGGHLVHAPMEPNASVVWVKDDSCEVWAATQSPADIQKVLAQFLGREAKDIAVHVTMSGGAFGRKFKCDYVHEAAAISQKINAPVQLTWTREEDTKTGYYHSINAQHIEAGIDEQGNIKGWLHRVAFPSIGTLFNPAQTRPSNSDFNAVDNYPYGIENFRSESGEAKAHTRIGWYRAVYAIFYGFSFSSFTDELAYLAGKDPLTYLNQLYDNNTNPDQQEQAARSKHVVNLAAEKSGWFERDKLPKNQAIGLAIHYSFQSYVAMAVRVEVNGEDIKVLQVDSAIDCGQVLNVNGATAQMEGAVVMGMGLALRTEVTFREGAVVNTNFHNYPVMRINEMPQVNVHIVDSEHPSTGLGEPGVAPFAPALSNAVFAASGKRYRDIPFKPMSV